MKYYLSPDNELFAYELDGSQDHLIPENYTLLSNEEAEEHLKNVQKEIDDSFELSQSDLNKKIKELRINAYRDESDPLFFKAQRGEATLEEWKESIEKIKRMYRYPQ
jgi:hypothetical protein